MQWGLERLGPPSSALPALGLACVLLWCLQTATVLWEAGQEPFSPGREPSRVRWAWWGAPS